MIYSQGVGSNVDALGKDGFMDGFSEWLNRMLGGVFGEGLEDNIVETYLRLAFNYEDGDEIYVFGFSRGAFCARSFAGLIGCAGIVSRMHAEKAWDAFRLYRAHPGPKATKFELEDYERARRDFRASYGKGKRAADGTRVRADEAAEVTYLGIFDTVGQRGVPSALGGMARFFNKRFGFHDMTIGTSRAVGAACGGGGREPARLSADAVGGRRRGQQAAALRGRDASTMRSAGSSARMATSAAARARRCRRRR